MVVTDKVSSKRHVALHPLIIFLTSTSKYYCNYRLISTVKTSERRKISLKHIVNIFRPGNKLPSDSVDDGLRCHGNGLAGSRSSSFPTFVGIATVEHELENQEKKVSRYNRM